MKWACFSLLCSRRSSLICSAGASGSRRLLRSRPVGRSLRPVISRRGSSRDTFLCLKPIRPFRFCFGWPTGRRLRRPGGVIWRHWPSRQDVSPWRDIRRFPRIRSRPPCFFLPFDPVRATGSGRWRAWRWAWARHWRRGGRCCCSSGAVRACSNSIRHRMTLRCPYHRLLALIRPGIDGWPGSLDIAGATDFHGYPSDAWFWDTTVLRGPVADRHHRVATGANGGAESGFPRGPGDSSRSWGRLGCSSRCPRVISQSFPLRYCAALRDYSTFRRFRRRWLSEWVSTCLRPRQFIVAACLLFHAVDLGGFARTFVRAVPWSDIIGPPSFAARILQQAHGERVAASEFDVWSQRALR